MLIRGATIAVRLGAGGLFVYAGLAKFAAPEAFADSIAAFHMLPAAFVGTTALCLPVFELLTGACLVTGWRVREAALAAGILALAFAAVLIQAWLRGLDPDCGCFGTRAWAPIEAVPPLVRNALLLAAAVFLRRPAGCDSPVDGGSGQSR